MRFWFTNSAPLNFEGYVPTKNKCYIFESSGVPESLVVQYPLLASTLGRMAESNIAVASALISTIAISFKT
jgi:hypothetical protein